ncbi:hypothetical protein [Neoroseomonas lacus]|uniref:hypothetical protein n=1 Tax=Neoroseomonas lacus TaxID=287609 RepID=UPI00166675DB|nr:hypothetical protein [Neoroseomonas lacus]
MRQEVAAARAVLSREEAAEVLAYAGRVTDCAEAAPRRLEAAEREVQRTERIVAGLEAIVAEKRAALAPLTEPGREGLLLWVDEQLQALDVKFQDAVEHVAGIIAQAVAIGDAVGAVHVIEPLLRVRLPGSLLRAATVLQVGTLTGMIQPEESLVSERGAGLRQLLDAARAAAGSDAERRAAAQHAEQVAVTEQQRLANDAAMYAEMEAMAAAQRRKVGTSAARDHAASEALA